MQQTALTVSNPDSVIVPVGGGIEDLKDAFLRRARRAVMEKHGNIHQGGEILHAEVYLEALKASLKMGSINRTLQFHMVADIARTEAWRFHPEGFDSLRDFLAAAGLGDYRRSNLVFIGDHLVPFCEANGIEIDPYFSDNNRAKTRAAIPAMRAVIEDNDPEGLKDILKIIDKAKTGRDIKVKYRKPRDKHGVGTTIRLGDGRVIMVLVLDGDSATETIVKRLRGGVKWELVADGVKLNGSVKVSIEDRGA